MNEWPTRVRIGTPPRSRITSGTAREQMRLYRIVAPGSSAEDAGGEDGRGGGAGQAPARLVDEEHAVGVAVEGQADVGAVASDPGLQVALVGRLDGVGRVVRERAVELAVHDLEVERAARSNTFGTIEAAHAVGGVGHDLQGLEQRPVDERHDVVGEVVEEVHRVLGAPPAAGRADGAGRGRPRPSAWISLRPVSTPTGLAPARHSLMPLYWAGLCDAVNMAPGASKRPAAKYTRSVEHEAEVDDVDALAAHAVAEGGHEADRPDGRMSWPTRIRSGRRRTGRTPAPMARHMLSSSCSGTVPRMS